MTSVPARPPPSVSGEWNVRQVAPCSQWKESDKQCPECGESVNLMHPHYQVELDRERNPKEGSKLTHERWLLAFCNQQCATEWLDTN
jgi:hypothetical protein